MCRPVNCRTCGKTTWAGCGNPVSLVTAGGPAAQWWDGRPVGVADAHGGGFLSKLFSR